MSDEKLDELFRNAAEKVGIEFEPSSWNKLKNQLEKMDVLFNFPKVKRTFGKFLKKIIKRCNN